MTTKCSFIANSAIYSLALITLLLFAGTAAAQGTLEFIGEGKISDLSADGSIAVGYTNNDLQVFRWTSLTGIVSLDGSTSFLGIGGGEPQVSADGSRISACIPAPDSLTVTQGVWTKGSGWEAFIPPTVPGGGTSSGTHGTPWHISGDGETVVGLVWLATQKARASVWNATDGIIDLGTDGFNSRANGTSRDGSVIVGWSDNAATGAWQPTVWENGTRTVLDPSLPVCQASGVTPSGHMIYGSSTETTTPYPQAQATIWTRSDTSPTGWDPNRLGVLPGTSELEGRSIIEDASSDGRILLGLNYLTNFSIRYFIWTPTAGLEPFQDYFARFGVTFAPTFQVQRISAISDDGRVFAGYGSDAYNPGTVSFLVTIDDLSDVPAGTRTANFAIESSYPNPFNPATTIALRIDEAGPVRLEIFNARGNLVRVLHDGPLPVGRHEYRWDGKATGGQPVASGIFFARARNGSGANVTRRLMLVK
jgi:uncharacterized membrane protein